MHTRYRDNSTSLVIYSHSLGGTPDAMALAPQGYIVLSLNHQDVIAPVVQRVDRSFLTFEFEIPGLVKGGGGHGR